MRKKQLSDFIHELHTKWKCSSEELPVEKVCEGLCSVRTLQYLESGKQKADKLLQDCIMERLGIGAENYEHFLDKDAYDRWEARHHILHCITFEEIERAEQFLAEYGKGYDTKNKLEKQFYLSMLAQVRRYRKASREELSALFKEAISLTVPEWEQKPLGELVLSVKELNLILEAEQYREEGARPERFMEVIEYLGKGYRDGRSMAKIYPKTVYFLCRCVMDETGKENRWTEASLLKYCNTAVFYLRNNGRMYFLWEILDIRGRLLERMAAELTARREERKADALSSLHRENEEWKKALEEIYDESHVPKETFEYCYLYVEKGVYCTNDVIRIRRKMLGMSPKELYDGICSDRTLRRLESRKTSPQRAIVEELFARLGLSRELTRTELVTSSPEVTRLMEELRKKVNTGCLDEADELRERVHALVSMEPPENRQALMRQEIISLWRNKKMSHEEHYKRLKEALELTMPYEAFLKEGEKYMTHEEQACIQNMTRGMDKDSEEFMICMQRLEALYRPYIDNGKQENVFNMFELIMGHVSSELGNRGEYEQSDRYDEFIFRGCLRFRRLAMLNYSLYGRWWNYVERKKKGIPTDMVLDDIEELKRCIVLSQLSINQKQEKFYQQKLTKLLEGD